MRLQLLVTVLPHTLLDQHGDVPHELIEAFPCPYLVVIVSLSLHQHVDLTTSIHRSLDEMIDQESFHVVFDTQIHGGGDDDRQVGAGQTVHLVSVCGMFFGLAE